MPLHFEGNIIDNTIWILEHILVAFHISEFRELSFTHPLVYHHTSPTMNVRLNAVLYVAQFGVELL